MLRSIVGSDMYIRDRYPHDTLARVVVRVTNVSRSPVTIQRDESNCGLDVEDPAAQVVNGKRTVYIPVTKRSDASTLAVLNAVKAALPSFREVVPEGVDVRLEFDQTGYVTNAIKGLAFEAGLGAVLTGLMVLLFLRDWRSALSQGAYSPRSLAIVGARRASHATANRKGAAVKRRGRVAWPAIARSS